MSRISQISRRLFLTASAAAGGGLALGVIPEAAAQGAAAEIGIWVTIAPDDTVTVRIARSEMGQGTLTGLAQMVADELDADWRFVRAEYVAPEVNHANKRAWGDMSTGGSRGIRASVEYVRKGGAAARAMLIETAAKRWGVPTNECSAALSLVTHTPTGRVFRYGELAAEAAKLPVPTDVAVKTPAQWGLIGRGVKRLDTVEKLSGKLTYAIDVNLPNMLNASIAQCPVWGGKLKSFDADKIKAMPGVRHVVAVGDYAVAVVADKWYQANTALKALPIVWDERGNGEVDSKKIDAHIRTGLDAKEAAVGLGKGDAEAGLGKAVKVIDVVYEHPFQNHATLEPMNCTALFADNKVEVWVASQNGDATLAAAAEAGGIPLGNVKVNKLHLGGGFGRRGAQDYTRQAVLIAKQIPGRPIKLIWSREEDMRHGLYRPITKARMRAGLDKDGNVVAMHARLAAQSILAHLFPARVTNGVDRLAFQGWNAEEFGYTTIPDLLIDHAMRNTHVPVGFWRGVNHNQNAISMECFIDELAHAAGRDPLEFRRKLLAKSPRHLGALNAAAEKAGWGTPLPKGVYRGLAQNCGFGSYAAAVAEISISRQGELTIHRIVSSIDCGYAVNPEQIAAQVEGSFVYGLSTLFGSEITIEKGRCAQSNFDNYEVMRLDRMPVVETVIAATGGFWGGVGEPTIAVAAPAVLNAIFAATGKRIRSLPLTHHDLRQG
jgi:isoquinoline 1-oxidoreductase beta subunit